MSYLLMGRVLLLIKLLVQLLPRKWQRDEPRQPLGSQAL